jgi:tetratricopeptide (TPR) repeat protein
VATNRLEILQQMVAQDPTNAFARYGLAMECAKSGELTAAVDEFRALIDRNPDYSAAYYHGGQTLERLGRIDEARALYEKGIEATRRSGDAHTRGEIEAALGLLPI